MKILVVYITMIFYMWIGAVILDLGLRMAVRQIEYNNYITDCIRRSNEIHSYVEVQKQR